MGVNVIYRISDINSTNPPPILENDRLRLNQLCLKSFVVAFLGNSIEMIFILDHCDGSWEDFIEKQVFFPYKIIRTNKGIDLSARMAVDVAIKRDTDILFQECDYLYRPNTGKFIINAINKFDFVSPYDHPDKYPGEAKISLDDGIHWKTTTSTTQTYGLSRNAFKFNLQTIKKYGYIDQAMWEDLLKGKQELWTPIPSIATHMVRDYMAPNVDWKKIWSFYL